jgi:hypothetical protein
VRQIFAGAALAIAGVAAFIEAARHHPVAHIGGGLPPGLPPLPGAHPLPLASPLSPTAYDLLHIAAWTLVIVGGLLVVTGLIRYWGSVRSSV